MAKHFIVGIDEAGRGPLAGPVSLGAVMVREGFNKKFFKGIKDSKKLSVEDRELWFALATEARRRGELDFCVSLISESVIDKHGIAYAVRLGIKRCLKRLEAPYDSQIFLDGGIKAPEKYVHQTTIIKGDEKVPIISLASICAKVVRDRKMVRLSKTYPEYLFHIHKGYGTLAHREAIKKHGKSEIHRVSFLRNLTNKP
ncbi:ribonuclease HII [Candidatus Parcubacteria bacterium]|nr:ribonuclease HII [Candidatus Parcubacteria bacterium]